MRTSDDGDLWRCPGNDASRRPTMSAASSTDSNWARPSERDNFRVLHSACPSSLPVMSSDPFASLAPSTEAFAREFREFMTRSPRPTPDSPAEEEDTGTAIDTGRIMHLLEGRYDEHHVFTCRQGSGLDSCRAPLLEPVISFRLVGPASQPCTAIQHKKCYKRSQREKNCREVH